MWKLICFESYLIFFKKKLSTQICESADLCFIFDSKIQAKFNLSLGTFFINDYKSFRMSKKVKKGREKGDFPK